MEEKARLASTDETLAMFNTPAQYINRFYVNVQEGIARLSFGEQEQDRADGVPGRVHMRAGVVMTLSNVLQLRDLLDLVCKDIQKIAPTPPDA